MIEQAKRIMLGRIAERGYQLLRAEVPKVTTNLQQGVAPPDVDYRKLEATLTVSARSARVGATKATLHLKSEEKKAAAANDSILKSLELHDTIFQNIKTDQGVRLGETPSDFSPMPGGELKEFDAEVPIVVFARVEGTDKTERQAALLKVFTISKAIAKLFFEDCELGGRVCNSELTRWTRGFDDFDGEPYAVSNVSLVINPSGKYDFQKS
ncbi:hypothetical protein Bpfe_031032 [Biomphalaria pfeifferi]|uniref:Uncharacterized protein n=1 Tax=Biomphalaria pfeifferi TaxID=112525 RepID=A0AAD8API5_BIOPF|nr:hypothetical protein Bpfe_031032 [Biomphalaria pfeifferi]